MNHDSSCFEEGLFAGALALSPSERAAFLHRACGGDAELCRHVEALLRTHEEHEGPLDRSPGDRLGLAQALEAQSPIPVETADGERIGRYHLRHKIGEGGFGVVWLAEQSEPVRRQVALKIIRPGMDTREFVARFEIERQALALMDHPNIARVFDGGTTENGRPFFAMELVMGTPITHYCDDRRLAMRARLELFRQVCDAVQHAHQKGIIHRDLKPSNILVVEREGVPVPKVIDFGIAKSITGRITDATFATNFAQLIGTPAYMSPEQMELGRIDIDTRSDIYNLGVLLYELLTGLTPFDAEQLSSKSFDELRQIIREQEPLKPSTRVTTLDVATRNEIAQRRGAEFAKLRSTLRGDLDWIVMRCLEKERARRYDTANGLARDLERHLSDEPVTARPPTAAYVLRKTVRRHRVAFATGGAIAASLVFALVASRVEAQRATTAEVRSAHVADFMKEMLRAIEPQAARGGDTTLLRAVFDQQPELIRRKLGSQPEVAIDLLETLGLAYSAIGDHYTSEELLREALALHEKQHGRENLTAARLLHEIGVRIELQGASYDPEVPLREALALRERLLPAKDVDLAETRAELGAFIGRSQPEKGAQLLRAAQAVQREVLGREHLAYARTQSYLGRTLARHNPEEAVALGQEAVEICRSVAGVDAPETIQAGYELAGVLFANRRNQEAERLTLSLVEQSRRIMGAAHPVHVRLLLLLSRIRVAESQLDAAESTVRESLAIAQRHDLFGPAGQIIQVLKSVLVRQQKSADAEQLLAAQVDLGRSRPRVPLMMRAMYPTVLANLLIEQRRFQEAEALAREALAFREQADTRGWLTQSSREMVAHCLVNQKKFPEAEAMLTSIYRRLGEVHAEYPERTAGYFARTIVSFIQLYRDWGRPDDAARWRAKGNEHIPAVRARGGENAAVDFQAALESTGVTAVNVP